MVVYLSEARLARMTRREEYMSWGVKNILLTPVHDLIQYCIQDWNQVSDPALNTSEL